MTLRHLADAVLAALIAPRCAGCARLLDHPLDGAVCAACWSAIDRAAPSAFVLSSRPVAGWALGPYEGALREVIQALKYDGRRSVAPRLAARMACGARPLLDAADLVVPVPLHPARERARGFNQADDLARGLGLPVVRAIRRIRGTQPQVDLPADQRRVNVADAFALADRSLAGRAIVLVDDVMTTGATLDACARVLWVGGAREVRALTAARVAIAPR